VLASPNGGFGIYELHGGEGDDVLFAGRSTTRSQGGLGNDRFSAQLGLNEVLDGGEGFDYVRDLANNSALSGDTIISIEGQQGLRDNDFLTAWGANSFAGWNNIIMGALGSDVIEGGGSSDLLIGNSFFAGITSFSGPTPSPPPMTTTTPPTR
jgi:Ca2+-binding RTX toxin-like protein